MIIDIQDFKRFMFLFHLLIFAQEKFIESILVLFLMAFYKISKNPGKSYFQLKNFLQALGIT